MYKANVTEITKEPSLCYTWVILGPLAGGALAAGVCKLIDTEK